MNIGVDIRCLLSPYRTGVGEFAFELLSALFEIDKQNQYFLFSNSLTEPNKYFAEKENVHVLWTRFPNKLFSFSEKVFHAPRIDKLLVKNFKLKKLDYFLSPHLNFTSLSSDTKHILLIHDLTFELFPEFLTLKQKLWHRLTSPKKQAEKAHLILTPSENTRRDVTNFYRIPENKIRVLRPGLSNVFTNDARSNVKEKYRLPEKFILFLGTVEPRKNISGLIKAFEAAYPKFLEPHYLVIAGAPGWKNKDISDQILRSPLRDKIILLGFVPEVDKPSLYRSARLFVYPSFYEGFGFPVLEAMSLKIPVITSNRSSLVEVAGSGAVLVNPYRADEIANAMIGIINSASFKKYLMDKRLPAEFNWKTTAEDLLQKFN